MARKPFVKAKAVQGRGHLADQEYAYFSANKALEFDIGAYVCFRSRESKKGFYIEKRSLGIAIDPAEYMRQLDAGKE